MPIAYMGISFMYPPLLVNNPRSKVAIANGQYLLIRRALYQRLGGYDTPELRGTVVDDLALAQVVKRSGARLLLVDGRDLVATHMYRSLREHWDGWGKNAAIGARGGALGIAIMTPGLPLITVGPFALLASGLLRRDWRIDAGGRCSRSGAARLSRVSRPHAAHPAALWVDASTGRPRLYDDHGAIILESVARRDRPVAWAELCGVRRASNGAIRRQPLCERSRWSGHAAARR